MERADRKGLARVTATARRGGAYARRADLGAVDRAIRAEPSASRQSSLSHARHSADCALAATGRGRAVRARVLARAARALRGRLDLPVRWTRRRREAARVPARLALPVRGIALVGGETQGARVNPRGRRTDQRSRTIAGGPGPFHVNR